MNKDTQPPRPYFLPPEIDFDSLPPAVQAAYASIIQPAYEELVLTPTSALERGAGMSIVYFLVEELLDQFALGRDVDLPQATIRGDRDAHDKTLQRHLRLINAKQTAIAALLRVRKVARPAWVPPLDLPRK